MKTLTEEQRIKWVTDGYIQIEGALNPEEVEFFCDKLDEVRSLPGFEPRPDEFQRGHYKWLEHADDLNPEGFMDRRDLLTYDEAFINLIDQAGVFDLIVDIMGPWILLSMSQAIVRAATSTFPGYTHTDGGEALRRIRVSETSRPLAMKSMYLLSDVDGPDSGNFTVFPGSHLRPFPEDNSQLNPHAPGAVQLTGKAGDAYVFSHALWHGPAPNHSNKARKTLLYNYCQMFVRWYDFEAISKVADKCTPRQRRLLGDLGHDWRPGSFFYAPLDQEEVIYGQAT